jgi:hypothetical protein
MDKYASSSPQGNGRRARRLTLGRVDDVDEAAAWRELEAVIGEVLWRHAEAVTGVRREPSGEVPGGVSMPRAGDGDRVQPWTDQQVGAAIDAHPTHCGSCRS